MTIRVGGLARTSGYMNVRLERASMAAPFDGVYELNLVGDAPTGFVLQALTPVVALHTWEDFPSDLTAVRIVAETNSSVARRGDPAPTLTGGTWLCEDIRGRGVIDNAQSTISFAPDGSVHGSGGCNRFRGPAKIRRTALRIGPLASTRMACAPALMDQEHKFFTALEAARAFRFEGTILKLVDEGENEIMRLTRLD